MWLAAKWYCAVSYNYIPGIASLYQSQGMKTGRHL